jgi:hypothetical protein
MQWTKRLIPVVGAAALLATSGVSAAAQETGADRSTPVYVTWSSGEPASVTEGTFDQDAGQLRGVILEGIPLEASDPRLSGVATLAINGNSEYSADTRAILESRTVRIVNDEGAWTGSATYVEAGDISGEAFEPMIVQETSLLVGEGAYEGLMVIGTADYLEANNQGEAVIYSISSPPVAEIPEVPAG